MLALHLQVWEQIAHDLEGQVNVAKVVSLVTESVHAFSENIARLLCLSRFHPKH